MEGNELPKIEGNKSEMQLVQGWAHYTGENKEAVKDKFKRVHECVCYTKVL